MEGHQRRPVEHNTENSWDSVSRRLSEQISPPDSLPHPPLLPPIGDGHDRPQLPLGDRIAARFDGRQEQNLLLEVLCQIQQIRDLSQASPRDVAQPGDLGLVGHNAVADQLV